MDLATIIDVSLCRVDVNAKNKQELLEMCAALAAQSRRAPGKIAQATFLKALQQREQEGSTGFGNEIAIPHARVEELKQFILFILASKRGVPFEALDKRRVKLFFVLLGPTSEVGDHLKILAFISRTLGHTGMKNEVLQAASPQAQVECFLRHLNPDAVTAIQSRAAPMSLLMLILYDEHYVEDVLEVFLEYGIEGATILNSTGMGQYISNAPLFGNFIGCMHQNKHHSKTILAMVSKPHIKAVVEAIEKVIGDITKDQSATVLSIDLAMHKGSMDIV